jgi:hypothetical protein
MLRERLPATEAKYMDREKLPQAWHENDAGYVVGMMTDDPKAMDEFNNILKTKPELFDQPKEKLK